ncbi:O-methyltransferase family 3 [Halalkaliarchaeum desulfuricum]|uniref:O-methyltransferase family 3 n=1 Tax=Halalkaliarchaeum desulfuricum TaxID=2055893 RepID=A0A343THJ8_9EURY|nr:O-methyltransferase [Halalkaliarchaeum desulfuricum]AUX08570.1 O-methyltransferase family 3 [Halalkaliarchaeum desulfuricum]
MIEILPEHSAEFVRQLGPEPDELLIEMDEYAADHDAEKFSGEESFPHVGPEVGGWLQWLAGLVEARRVFEFGSGFGYSAYWFARALPHDGEIVLTDLDETELQQAQAFLDRGGVGERARYEPGNALETIERYDGPFDVVLLDHRNDQYPEAFEAVREKVAPGGLLVADNVMTAVIVEFEQLARAFDGGEPPTRANDHTKGIYDYLTAVQEAPEFETGILPVGGGIAVSYRRRTDGRNRHATEQTGRRTNRQTERSD